VFIFRFGSLFLLPMFCVLGVPSGANADWLFGGYMGAAGTSCDGFMPPFSCVASRFWPQERQSLMALAQAAAGPYR